MYWRDFSYTGKHTWVHLSMRIFLTSSWVKQGKGHNSYTDQYDTPVLKKKKSVRLKRSQCSQKCKCMTNTKNFWHKKYIFCVNLNFFLECLMCVRWSVWTLHLLWELISLYFVIPHRSETHPNPIHFNEPGFQ